MIPQHQTEFGARRGNCWSACLASILEVPLSEVPNFCGDPALRERFWSEAQEWLASFGLMCLEIRVLRQQDLSIFDCYWIAGGLSPRGDFDHAVVYRGAEMVHDPHPSGAGHKGHVKYGGFLLPRDPARCLEQVRRYVPLMEAP